MEGWENINDIRNALDESSIVAITDDKGVITYVNKQFCQISKYAEDELIGKNHKILKSGYHSDEFYDNLWNTISSGKPWHGDLKNKAKDGTFYWVRTTIVPTFNESKNVRNYVSIRTDITSQIEQAEKLVQDERMNSIGQFASRMSHDLRNPLSILKVTLENMRMSQIDGNQLPYLSKMDRAINRMSHQIEEVLDFVKGFPVELDKTHLSVVIQNSLDSIIIPDDVKVILPKNDVELICDERQLAVAINNLILNGIQAISTSGTVEIFCNENDDEIIIQVKDSGVGIPKDQLGEIFEPLFTTKQKGTGLGLVSVKSIINSHGGVISVTSSPTVFTIILPKVSDKD